MEFLLIIHKHILLHLLKYKSIQYICKAVNWFFSCNANLDTMVMVNGYWLQNWRILSLFEKNTCTK